MLKTSLSGAKFLRSSARTLIFSALATGGMVGQAMAQDVHFQYNGAGVTKSSTEWGVDTAWPSQDNVRQTIFHMGVDQIDLVRVNYFMDEPLDANGNIGPNSRAQIDWQMQLYAMSGGNKPLAITPASESGTDPSYLDANGNGIPAKWLAVMEATARYINKPIAEVEVFNEPDYWAGYGTTDTLRQIILLAKASNTFKNSRFVGASTLCSCSAQGWFDPVSDILDYGSTHQLAKWWGSGADNYINFYQHVQSVGKIAYNPEIHSMAEVLYNAEYGVIGGIWWGDALLPRGKVANAVQGKRLGYAENRPNESAAAVYRSTDGKVYGFAGSFERTGPHSSYRFISDDQDVYFNGIGPLREFSMATWADQQGGFFNIEATPGVPALDGSRWKIVNRATGKVIEVAAGGTADGDNVRTGTDANANYQKWDISRDRSGYIHILNTNSLKSLDDYGWSLVAGANIAQWAFGGGLNQSWHLQPTGDGYFYILNGHSNLYMQADASTANLQQENFNGGQLQQWSFVNVDPAVGGTEVAHYKFDGNATSATGSNNGTAYGSPAYGSGKIGQAITMDGVDDYVKLPNGVAGSKDISIATWVYWKGGNANQRIFDFGMPANNSNPVSYLFLTPSGNNGLMHFGITNAGYSEEQTLETSALPVNQWVHVALTLRGNTVKLYLNGVLKSAGQIYMDPTDVLTSGTQNNYIGKSQWTWDPAFNGNIDAFHIYNYGLSAAEVNALVAAGNVVLTSLNDSFEGDFSNWDQTGWDINSAQYVSGSKSAHAGSGAGNLTTKDINATGKSSIHVQFWYRPSKISASTGVNLQAFDGTNWVTLANLGSGSNNSWNYYQTDITSAQYLNGQFKVRVTGGNMKGTSAVYLDDFVVQPN